MAMFGFAGDDRTVDQVRFEEERMMNFVARNDELYRSDELYGSEEAVNTATPLARTQDET